MKHPNAMPHIEGRPRIVTPEVDLSSHHYIVLTLLNRWIATIAVQAARGVLLDFGCGGQPYRSLFEPAISRYIGADIAAASGVQLDLRIAPGKPLQLPDGSVDTVLSTQTIEHVFDVTAYVRECSRVLRPGGALILTAPMQWRLHEPPHDYWRFTRYAVEGLLETASLRTERLEPCGGTYALIGQILVSHLAETGRGRPRLFRLINRLALWLDRRIPDTEDTLLWMCIARKPADLAVPTSKGALETQ